MKRREEREDEEERERDVKTGTPLRGTRMTLHGCVSDF